MSKKRAFVRYTKTGKLIPGSLIVTTNGGYPDKSSTWKEVDYDLCCGGGGCNNCTPGTIGLSQTFNRPLTFPGPGILMLFIIDGVGCPDLVLNPGSGNLEFYLIIPGQVFNFQDIVDLINTSEIAKRNGISSATLTVSPEGETIQITVDKCSCLGIYLSGSVNNFHISTSFPALPSNN